MRRMHRLRPVVSWRERPVESAAITGHTPGSFIRASGHPHAHRASHWFFVFDAPSTAGHWEKLARQAL